MIITIIGLQIYAMLRTRETKRAIAAGATTIAVVVLLAFMSTPVANRCIYAVIESGVSDKIECPFDIVMVLGGGYYPGSEEFKDVLTEESIARVNKGVQVFKTCGAKYYLVSGRMKQGSPDRHCKLMADMSKGLGVPEDKIVLDANSINTRDHVVRLERMGIAEKSDRIAVITSPWHMKRSIHEFIRVFPNSVGIAAYPASYVRGSKIGVLDWMPQAQALERTTLPFHEIIGMAWYRIVNIVQGAFGVDIDVYRK